MMVGLGTYTSMENQVAPYSVQTTLGIQRELSEDLSLSVDGVWTKGYKMLLRENYNPIIVGTLIHADPTKGDIWAITDGGKSGYKALMLTLNKRYSHGWSLEVSYTLSWSKANTESWERPHSYEEDNCERQYGYTNRDARHKLTASGIFNIPLGFQITGILYYRSKTPWNALYGFDKNLDGLNSDYLDYRRNSRRGFDNFYINTRISKFINIDRFRFQVFGEVYNVFNKGNFYNVYSRENSPNFGGPSEARDPRIIQLGIRFDF